MFYFTNRHVESLFEPEEKAIAQGSIKVVLCRGYDSDGESMAKTFDNKAILISLKEKYDLTPREMEIIGLLTHGFDNKTLASILVLSEKTVKVHLRNIYKKLGVNSRIEVISFILRHELKIKAN